MSREDLEGDEFTDRYTEAMEQLIEAKREHVEPPKAPEEQAAPGEVVDLMAALKESVAKAQASRGEDATVHEMPKKTTAKKTTKKAPTKKTAAKKTTKKTAAKKPRSA
jgi:DNA end-binding protein Ku